VTEKDSDFFFKSDHPGASHSTKGVTIMTAATLGLDTAPGRRAWHALFWVIPLTALWIALNYAFPVIGASGASTAATRLAVHVLIALGLWLGLERTELTSSQQRNVWLAVMIPFTLWLAVIWSAAISGAFKPGAFAIPLQPIATLGPVVLVVPILLRSRRIGEVLDAMPASWMIALQVLRVNGFAFLIGWAYGTVPGVFALPAGIGDILTGLLAVPVAISLGSGSRESRRTAIAWNIFGLLDFAIAISIGLAIAFRLIDTGFASATGGLYPVVMIPAFGVPTWIILHAVSLRQLSRRNRAATR
jgi:hypothetical protein